jgi:uncharacterized protein YndB with AHSA1/START domain
MARESDVAEASQGSTSMPPDSPPDPSRSDALSLVVRRTIRAPVERVFEAWTKADQIRRWWGPGPVTCLGAEVDLRVGGAYRIGNQLPDGTVMWITGVFELVSPPRELVYSWSTAPDAPSSERVTVRFEPREGATEVTIVHERIPNGTSRDQHQQGWFGCLDGLERYLG